MASALVAFGVLRTRLVLENYARRLATFGLLYECLLLEPVLDLPTGRSKKLESH